MAIKVQSLDRLNDSHSICFMAFTNGWRTKLLRIDGIEWFRLAKSIVSYTHLGGRIRLLKVFRQTFRREPSNWLVGRAKLLFDGAWLSSIWKYFLIIEKVATIYWWQKFLIMAHGLKAMKEKDCLFEFSSLWTNQRREKKSNFDHSHLFLISDSLRSPGLAETIHFWASLFGEAW